jgi:hypothetical protein
VGNRDTLAAPKEHGRHGTEEDNGCRALGALECDRLLAVTSRLSVLRIPKCQVRPRNSVHETLDERKAIGNLMSEEPPTTQQASADSHGSTSLHETSHGAAQSAASAPEAAGSESAHRKSEEHNVCQHQSKDLTSLGLYQAYRSYVEHEDELINQRIQRLILSHGGLLSAAVLIITRWTTENRLMFTILIVVIAMAGIRLGYLQWKAIDAAFDAITWLIKGWNRCCEREPHRSCQALLPGLVGGGEEGTHKDANGAVIGLIHLVLMIWILALALCLLYFGKTFLCR